MSKNLIPNNVRVPKIYVYSIAEHKDKPWVGHRDGVGWLKIGYTDRDVRTRIKEQLGTAKVDVDIKLSITAVTNDGDAFMDHAVHAKLERAGVHRIAGSEWFECTLAEAEAAILSVQRDEKFTTGSQVLANFGMRPEQEVAVDMTARYLTKYADLNAPPSFLWNAKMRFGKTFTTYQLAKRMGWSRILVLTYKPAVGNAWEDDMAHVDFEGSGWRYQNRTTIDRDGYKDLNDSAPLVWFASFQDVLGTTEDGEVKERNEGIHLVDWDCVVMDEYHYGAWRESARSLYLGEDSEAASASEDDEIASASDVAKVRESLTASNYLYLSGTPFRAIANGEFMEDQTFTWSYRDEQNAKNTVNEHQHKYASLPKMHMLTYKMPDTLRAVATKEDAQFSLGEFFKADTQNKFIHEDEVQKWLDLMRGEGIHELYSATIDGQFPPLPYKDSSLLDSLKHTIWFMPSVASCVAMKQLLIAPRNKTTYGKYQVIMAAGPDAGMGAAAQKPVDAAITKNGHATDTITLTCGKLLTGVTVPEWGGILMLRELNSPETYFQAAFRVQSPWRGKVLNPLVGGVDEVIYKNDCYIIDFSPNRALSLISEYASKLRSNGDSETMNEEAVREFIEFFPVLSFDGSTMQPINASDIIDYITAGTTPSMLAARWNSNDLIDLNAAVWKNLANNPELLESLSQVDDFRNVKKDVTAMVSRNEEIGKKPVGEKKASKEDKARDKETEKQKASFKKKLQKFIATLPAFMYLTSHRECSVTDLITQVEPELFKTVTALTVRDFEMLVEAGVFNKSKMSDAVRKFRQFEDPSLSYGERPAYDEAAHGGF